LILSVKLQSGRFTSELKVPLAVDDETRDKIVMQWIESMENALKIYRSEE